MPLGKNALTTALGSGLLLLSAHVLAAGIVVEERALGTPKVATQALPRVDAEPLHSQPLDGGDDKSDSNSGTTWEMYQQLQQLQQEVARLRGTVEEQGHLLERMRNDQKAQYTDLDLRINGLGEKLAATQQPVATTQPAAEVPNSTAAVANIEEERKAYLAAYKVFTDQGPDKAIAPMQAFVTRYPDSTFAPNAHYWLGEFYLAASKPDLENARKQFETVLSRFSSHAKAPGSLYKLGTIAELQNKPEQARKHMQDLLSRYPGSSEATLASNFLKQPAKPAPAKK